MAMCPNCNKQIHYSKLLRFNFKVNKECPHCGCRLYETKKSRNRMYLVTYFPVSILILFFSGFQIPFTFGFPFIFLCAVILMLITIKYQSFSTEEEPWF